MIIWRSSAHTGKAWARGADGAVVAGNTHHPSLWRVEHESRVDDSFTIEQLFELIQRLEAQPNLKLQMGRLTDVARVALSRGESIKRQAFDSISNPQGTTRDDVECLLVVDVDGASWPNSVTLADGAEAVKALIEERAPAPLKGVDVVYQHTGSAGFKDGVYLRLYFLSTPTTQADILERLQTGVIPDPHLFLDKNLYNRNQAINTAPPRLIGLDDPLTLMGLARSGLIVGARRRVELPKIEHTRDMRRKEEPAASSSYCSKGLALRLLADKLQQLEGVSAQRFDTMRKGAFYVGGLIAAGNLDEEQVVADLMRVAQVNGFIKRDRPRSSVERTIRSGIAAGKLKPVSFRYDEARGTDNARASPSRAQSKRARIQQQEVSGVRPASTEAEIREAVEQTLSRAVIACDRDKLVLLEVAAGAGKSNALTRLALSRRDTDQASQALWRWRDDGGVVIAFKTYELLAEAAARLQAGGLTESANTINAYQVVRGRLRRCAHWVADDLLDPQAKQERRQLIEIADEAQSLLTICSTCPHRQGCALASGKGGHPPLVGRISLMTHAMLPHLHKCLREGDAAPLVVLDESPATMFETTATLSELSCFTYRDAVGADDADAAWRSERGEVRQLVEMLTPLIEQTMRTADNRKKGAYLDEVVSKQEPQTIDALKRLSERVKSLDLDPPKEGDPKRAQARIERLKQHDATIVTQRAINLLLAAVAVILNESPQPLLLLCSQGEISLSSWARFKLPPDSPVLIADATADESRWQRIAVADGRSFHKERADLVAQPLKVLMWTTSSLSRSKLFDADGDVSARALGALSQLGDTLARRLDTGEIAVGCHYKQLADALDDALKAEEGAQAALVDHRLVRWLGARPVSVGYTGADGVGSNRFEGAAALILLSDPWSHLLKHQGEELSLAMLTGAPRPDDEALSEAYQSQALRTLVQWVGRLRHIRNPDRQAIIAGALAPEVIVAALSSAYQGGMSVEVIDLPAGRPTDTNLDEVRAAVASLLEIGHSVTADDVVQMIGLGVKDDSIKRVARSVISAALKGVESNLVDRPVDLDLDEGAGRAHEREGAWA